MVSYERLFEQLSKKGDWWRGRTVALDPGGTTGLAVFDNGKLTHSRQCPTGDVYLLGPKFIQLLTSLEPERIVLENYLVYSWKSSSHSWDDMHTSRLIGAIECWAGGQQIPVPLYKQTAQQAKGWATDERLKDWGMYDEGLRHARDAVRHGIYWSLFGPSKKVIKEVPDAR